MAGEIGPGDLRLPKYLDPHLASPCREKVRWGHFFILPAVARHLVMKRRTLDFAVTRARFLGLSQRLRRAVERVSDWSATLKTCGSDRGTAVLAYLTVSGLKPWRRSKCASAQKVRVKLHSVSLHLAATDLVGHRLLGAHILQGPGYPPLVLP